MTNPDNVEGNGETPPLPERPYVSTHRELTEEIAGRAERAPEIRVATDAFVEEAYGIAGFSAIRDEHFGLDADREQPISVLARQVGTVNGEDVAHYLASWELGLEPVAWSFTADSYTGGNHYKKSLLKQRWIEALDRNGEFITRVMNIAANPSAVEQRPLSGIVVKTGESLPDYHATLRQRLFGDSYREVAAEPFLLGCLRATDNPPEFVFVRGLDGKYVRASYSPEVAMGDVRPPADWYYPLDMCCYLDGSVVLCETYENPEKGVDGAKRHFLEAVAGIEVVTGVRPLVAETPPLRDDYLRYNPKLLDDPDVLPALAAYARQAAENGSIKELFDRIACAALAYGHEVPT